ncbi:Histidine kinase domain protein [Verrucomicrobiia bacterium DG1235]|nr:Histidine kinase domain protein [Verrucomicrobiae bacterium DG1235]
MVAGAFGLAMMLVALVLPFAYAENELGLGLTILQLILWAAFCAAWVFQGYFMEQAGIGFRYDQGTVDRSSLRARWREIVLYLFVFGPLCFAYVYVSFQNTGYFGFNYVLMFVLAGFSTLVFPVWLALVYLVYQTIVWIFLSRFMWGGWMQIDDQVTMFSGLLFSSMMFYIFRRERESRSKAVALTLDLDEANEKLRAFSGQIEELAATQERNRIAREIHDTIGHSLTVVNMQLETSKALIDSDKEKAKRFLEKAQEVTRQGLTDVRSSVASLRSSPLDGKSLPGALEGMMSASFGGGVKTRFELKGEVAALNPASEAALYRSAQEALTNVRKHADASEVKLSLDFSFPECVKLVVADNGKGSEKVEGGFGIMGIRERIQLLDGEMRVSTSPGQGLELSLSLPR